ncbi:MAG: exodeoxyribonuclease III [Defluviicoccus sp.]
MLTIATWNVNSIKVRLPHLLQWLASFRPDIVLLQETKVIDEAFPRLEIEDAGYNAATVGQKTYNGVAVLSRQPIDVLAKALPGDDSDEQARYLEVFTAGFRVASIYVPNGNPVESAKFPYKLGWLERLYQYAHGVLTGDDRVVFGGDFNIAPAANDVYNPAGWKDDALCRPESRAGLRKILYLGLTDALRAHAPGATGPFTWWDYRRGAFAADEGLRIDHLLLSPQAADRLRECGVDRTPRGWDRPSDHAPAWCRFNDDDEAAEGSSPTVGIGA